MKDNGETSLRGDGVYQYAGHREMARLNGGVGVIRRECWSSVQSVGHGMKRT